MEKLFQLKAEKREKTGSHAAVKERESGKIPAIIYGHKEETVGVLLDAHDFNEAMLHGHRILELAVGKKKENALVKELQYDHLGKNIIHADLLRVSVTEKVKLSVRVELRGTAKGAAEGGVVVGHAGSIEVECMVTAIPESIKVSVKDLGVGDTIHAGDVVLPEGVKLVSSPELLIAGCEIIAEVKTTEELAAEAPTSPEVISKGKEETEEEAAEQK